LGRQYKEHLSDFKNWDAKSHAQEWLVFPENIGEHLSMVGERSRTIDETSISQGELYTVVTNKAAHGGKGTVVAIVSGTESDKIIEALERIPEVIRSKVKEVTLDTVIEPVEIWQIRCTRLSAVVFPKRFGLLTVFTFRN
jgi:hypothetical protein